MFFAFMSCVKYALKNVCLDDLVSTISQLISLGLPSSLVLNTKRSVNKSLESKVLRWTVKS